MAHEDAAKPVRRDKHAAKRGAYWREMKRRWPVLELDRRDPGANLLGQLHVDHPLYPIAAWASHHAEELDDKSRRGLYAALEGGWPKSRGRVRTRRVARMVVAVLVEAGVPKEIIATKLERSPRYVKDLLRESRAGGRVNQPRITPLEAPGGNRRPYDPANGIVGELLSQGPPEPAQTKEFEDAEALARELGFDSLEDLQKKGYSEPRPG